MAHATVREEHPLPAVLMHWTHLISMAVLIFTGFYIHKPFFPASMGLMRALHFFFMFLLIVVAIIRVYWAFFGQGSASHGSRVKIRDSRHFGPQDENRGTLIPTIQYYLFLRKRPPAGGKFNGLQKGTYVFWLFLIAIQAVTGFAIWSPTQYAFRPLTYAVGGMMAMRGWHYIIMWLFIITVAIHIYLSAVHADQARLMFLWQETPGDDEPVRPVGTTTGSSSARRGTAVP